MKKTVKQLVSELEEKGYFLFKSKTKRGWKLFQVSRNDEILAKGGERKAVLLEAYEKVKGQ